MMGRLVIPSTLLEEVVAVEVEVFSCYITEQRQEHQQTTQVVEQEGLEQRTTEELDEPEQS